MHLQEQLLIEPVNSNDATIYGGEIIYNRYFGNFGVNGNYAYHPF